MCMYLYECLLYMWVSMEAEENVRSPAAGVASSMSHMMWV